jgi:hypothetical protein
VPPLAKLTDAPAELLAAMAASFLGGETSARLLRQLVFAVLVDRTWDYVRCWSALGLQRLLTCERIVCREVEPGWLVRAVSTLEPDLQPLGLCFAQVRPRGEVLSARVEARPGEYSIHLGPLHFAGWWPCHALDLAGSWAACGRVPEVIRAWRLVPEGWQPGLRPLTAPSGRGVDLGRDDVGQELLAERARIASDPMLSAVERERVSGCLKLYGHVLTFGLPARSDSSHRVGPVQVRVFSPDGSERVQETERPEQPARWTFLPAASAVAACSRFLTARLVARVEALGGAVIATAVDSVAIVATPDHPTPEEGR